MGENNTVATRDQLLDGPNPRRYGVTTLPVREILVRYQSLTDREVSDYQMMALNTKGRTRPERLRDATLRLMVLCLVDAKGNRLFANRDIPKLGGWDSKDTSHLYKVVSEHCGINPEDIEDLAKNEIGLGSASESTPDVTDSSDSPSE